MERSVKIFYWRAKTRFTDLETFAKKYEALITEILKNDRRGIVIGLLPRKTVEHLGQKIYTEFALRAERQKVYVTLTFNSMVILLTLILNYH